MSLETKEVCIAVIGTGGVGSVFINQLANLHKTYPVSLRLIYIAMVDKALYHSNYSNINIGTAVNTMEKKGVAPPNFSSVIDYLKGAPGRVIVGDNTSSYELWESITNAAKEGDSFIFHESSVGAGMPAISILQEMVKTGDEITRIEGVFSGTMSHLFYNYSTTSGNSGGNWFETVRQAKNLGYTEPDPRDDLNGLDVARKVTIPARIAGCPIESPTSFPVESLILKELESTKRGDVFLQKLPAFDQQMQDRKLKAEKQGKVLCYIDSVDMALGKATVGLQMLDKSYLIANLKGSNNLISFYTKRYNQLPLIIRGAGAGVNVTAIGITGDC
ncbi:homoserine dehydrogenase [Fusarium oxysporum f. sp. radicis-lycopersici 26381]|nr:homoserine dehydrogenase [Fusarium oxysporum f. sp. radicis-lycopersici 26381]